MVLAYCEIRHGMESTMAKYLALILLIFSSQTMAATIFRCVDASGKVTFTQQNCPDQHGLDAVVSAYNQPPSGSSEPVKMATTEARAGSGVAPSRSSSHNSSVSIAGSNSGSTGCSTGLSDQDLRKAKVQGRVVPGMSRKDVESMYGTPNGDNASGAGTSTYWNDKYVNVTSVSFDGNGCVRSSYMSGSRKK